MNSSKLPISCVLFDLDGTLLDTAPDLINALNHVLSLEGKSTLPYETVRNTISGGGVALILLGFGSQQNELDLHRRYKIFLDYYAKNICVDTTFFQGIENVLDELEQVGIAWGVVTNKASDLTKPLMDAIGLSKRASSVISGDTLPQKKPSPEPMYLAASECGVLTTECIYIGDAKRDIDAANRAGMTSLIASYGYIGSEDQPETWQANGIIQNPEEILDWIDYEAAFKPSERLCH